MLELSVALVIVLPLGLLAYTAMHLLRLGLSPADLSEAARKRLAGLGLLLLYVVVLASLATLGTGIYCLLRVLKIA